MDKRCVRCQKDIPIESNFCPHCGHNQSFPFQVRIDNYMVWAILSTLFCCLPLGVVSIIYSSKVESKVAMGDMAGAKRDAENAKNWAIASAITGVAIGVIVLIINIVSMMAIITAGGN